MELPLADLQVELAGACISALASCEHLARRFLGTARCRSFPASRSHADEPLRRRVHVHMAPGVVLDEHGCRRVLHEAPEFLLARLGPPARRMHRDPHAGDEREEHRIDDHQVRLGAGEPRVERKAQPRGRRDRDERNNPAQRPLRQKRGNLRPLRRKTLSPFPLQVPCAGWRPGAGARAARRAPATSRGAAACSRSEGGAHARRLAGRHDDRHHAVRRMRLVACRRCSARRRSGARRSAAAGSAAGCRRPRPAAGA